MPTGKTENNNSQNSSASVIASMVVGNLEPFQDGDDVAEWLERFENFVAMNSVSESDRSKWLVLYGGKVLHRMAKLAAAPEKPTATTFSTLKASLLVLCTGHRMAEVARQSFYSRVQNSGESSSDFALALKDLAAECEFGDF